MSLNINKCSDMINFDDYSIQIDNECLHQDFDDVDLYGERYEESTSDSFGDDIEFN